MRLRARTAADEALHRAIYASTHEFELAALGDLGPTYLDHQLKARDAGYAGAQHDVVLVDDQDAGYLVTALSPTGFTIVDIALLPAYRGTGAGETLLRWACARAGEAGVPARLSVLPENPARRLYERLGFTVTGGAGLHLTMEWEASCTTA